MYTQLDCPVFFWIQRLHWKGIWQHGTEIYRRNTRLFSVEDSSESDWTVKEAGKLALGILRGFIT
jgi:hypothetical protein